MLVAVVGGGQLGRMLALAGIPLGLRFRFLDPNPDAPVGGLGELIVADYDDEEALQRLADGASVVTYEFENVPVDAARTLERWAPVFPPPRALEVAQDRVAEKTLFGVVDIPFHAYRPVDSLEELQEAIDEVGTPSLLKTRRLGYDGKGQAVIAELGDAAAAWERVGGTSSILESLVEFDRELSVIAVRDHEGRTLCYPLVENRHEEGILRRSVAPAPNVTLDLQAQAEVHANRIMDEIGYVGVLALELFQVGERVLANELAPRVHNSGHWSIEGSETSQFENHLRAVLGLPLGSTAPRGASGMLNLIGSEPEAAGILAVPGAHLHRYGKEPRPGRKLGHVTVVAEDAWSRDARLAQVARIVDPPPDQE
ncbi:MAG: 5-(carboxyamino)imidazole ribonucleotide synthase [Actinomycetota bacterium]